MTTEQTTMHTFLEKLSDRQRKIYETLPSDILKAIAQSKAPTPPSVNVPGEDDKEVVPHAPATAPAGGGKRPLPMPRPRSTGALVSDRSAGDRSHAVGAAAFSRTALLGRDHSLVAVHRARAQSERAEDTAARGDGELLPVRKRHRASDVEYASASLRFCSDPERALR